MHTIAKWLAVGIVGLVMLVCTEGGPDSTTATTAETGYYQDCW